MMLNVVADKEGVGAAVLIRSCSPISGTFFSFISFFFLSSCLLYSLVTIQKKYFILLFFTSNIFVNPYRFGGHSGKEGPED